MKNFIDKKSGRKVFAARWTTPPCDSYPRLTIDGSGGAVSVECPDVSMVLVAGEIGKPVHDGQWIVRSTDEDDKGYPLAVMTNSAFCRKYRPVAEAVLS